MLLKLLSALMYVGIGVASAIAVYWILNKIAELLPGKVEERIKPFLYILPAYLAIAVYLLYPTLVTIFRSFQHQQGATWENVGLQNYSDLLATSAFRSAMFNTLLWLIIVPACTVALGLAVATLADRLSARSENLAKSVIFLPMAVSLVGAGKVWNFVYAYVPTQAGTKSDQIGILNGIKTGLGGEPTAWLNVSTLHLNSLLLMVILLWSQVGFSMVLLSAAVKGVPADTLEAARIDGANERQIFGRVIVPQIRGTMITVFVTVLITVMKIFDVVYVTTGGQFNTNIVGNYFFSTLYKSNDYGKAYAIVVMTIIAIIPVMIFQVRHFRAEEANA
jgi:alpha-glucoside transport system permease protein